MGSIEFLLWFTNQDKSAAKENMCALVNKQQRTIQNNNNTEHNE